MKISFYEKVIIRKSRKFPELNGRSGVMVGISEENGVVYGYAVNVDGEEEGYYFATDEIIGTGELLERSLLYDDTDRIQVKVTEDGNGHISTET